MRMEGIKEKGGPYSSFSSDFINNIEAPQIALNQVRSWAKENIPVAEHMIHRLYALLKKSSMSLLKFLFLTEQAQLLFVILLKNPRYIFHVILRMYPC